MMQVWHQTLVIGCKKNSTLGKSDVKKELVVYPISFYKFLLEDIFRSAFVFWINNLFI